MYLKSTDPNFNADVIEDAFSALYGKEGEAHFEHGQWWICCCFDGSQYSVVDAVGDPSAVCNGLSFEQVSEGDEE